MSKEFLHMRSSKSQDFWLPVTDYPRAFRSSTRGSQAQGTRLPESGPQALHKNHEAGCRLTTESGGPFNNISGRHFDHSFVNRNIKSPQNAGHRLAGISRVPNQLQEVKSNSIPADCFLGDAGRFGFHAVHST